MLRTRVLRLAHVTDVPCASHTHWTCLTRPCLSSTRVPHPSCTHLAHPIACASPCAPAACTLHVHGRLVARPFCTPIVLPPLLTGCTLATCASRAQCSQSVQASCKPRACLAHPGARTLHAQGSHLARLLCSNCGATARASHAYCTHAARPQPTPCNLLAHPLHGHRTTLKDTLHPPCMPVASLLHTP